MPGRLPLHAAQLRRQHRERCFRENAIGPEVLAQECARRELRLLTFSSDQVFDGSVASKGAGLYLVSPGDDGERSVKGPSFQFPHVTGPAIGVRRIFVG